MNRRLGNRGIGPASRIAARALGLLALTACALLTGCGAPDREATEATGTVQQLMLTASSPFVTRAGVELRIDGQPFHFAGTNNYYLWYAPLQDEGTDKNVREIFEDAQAMGLTVIRTWGFGDGDEGWGYTLQPNPGEYNDTDTGFAHFDEVVAMAAEYDIRLIIPLINNWDDFGGMQRYVDWTGGGDHDEFYTREECKDLYKRYVEHVITRFNPVTQVQYKDDPTIMAWELANEPRAMTAGTAVLDGWIGEMSDYIRSLDPNHLISTGSEGFYNGRSGFTGWPYNGSQGVDFRANHSHPNIDFASIHVYPDYWDLDPVQTLEWFNVHVDDSRHELGKPIIVGEFGKTNTVQEPNIRDETMTEWYRLFESKNFAGDMFWTLYGSAYPDYDGFGIYYPEDTSTVLVIEDHSGVMNAKIAQSESVDEVALAEATTQGTVAAGSYQDTRVSDGTSEALTEQTTNGSPSKRTSVLEHTWQFWVTQGAADPVLRVRAHHSPNSEGDDFLLQYSTDGIQFSNALTITKTADDASEQTFPLPSTARERVWIRAVDTDRSKGNASTDTLFVDHLVVRADGIDIEPNEPPSVSIDTPTDGSVVSGLVGISAMVTDPEGLGTVDFAVDNGNYEAMDYDASSDEYTAEWDASLASQGAHTIFVRATDQGGQTVIESVTVLVDYNPDDDDPTASIVLPTDGSQVSGDSVLIQATAADDFGVDHVEYAIDGGAWTGMSLLSGTWEAAWDSTPLPNGDHEVAVRAIDTVGQASALSTVTVEVVNVGGDWVHVLSIVMDGKKMGKNFQANAGATIVDASNQPVEGVTITMQWSGASPPITRTAVTDATGIAYTYSDRGPAGTYTATVTNLTCTGCYYDAAANVESSDSIALH